MAPFIRVTLVARGNPAANPNSEGFMNALSVINSNTGEELVIEKDTYTNNTTAIGLEVGETYDVMLADTDRPTAYGMTATRIDFGTNDRDQVFRIEAANTVGQKDFNYFFNLYNQGTSHINNLQDAVEMMNMCSAETLYEMLGGQTADWPNLDLSSWKLPNIASSGVSNPWSSKADNQSGVTQPQYGVACDGSEPIGPTPEPPAPEPPVRDGDLMLVQREGKSYHAEIKEIQSALMPLDLRTLPPMQ